MASSKQLVYISDINPHTWLLMSKRDNSTCLRNYSGRSIIENRNYSANDLETLLAKNGSYTEKLPAFSKNSFKDKAFWREQIEFRNVESDLKESNYEMRLLNRFQEECKRATRGANLQAVFQRWVKRFQCIKNKAQYNHWDNDPAHGHFSDKKGIGWTSKMLEESRKDGSVSYIRTGLDQTDFSLIAMELGLGISSTNNKFRNGRRDFIKPDGLGLRQNGYLTVLEIKGPQDDKSLIDPMLQATCAALAIFAKRQNICKIACESGNLRPQARRAVVPMTTRSIGVHIISSAKKGGGPRSLWTPEVENACKEVLNAFKQLEYIAYSFITEEQANRMTCFRTHYYITPHGVCKFE